MKRWRGKAMDIIPGSNFEIKDASGLVFGGYPMPDRSFALWDRAAQAFVAMRPDISAPYVPCGEKRALGRIIESGLCKGYDTVSEDV